MPRFFIGVGIALLACNSLHADNDQAWQDAELKKLSGRWTTVREDKGAAEKTVQTRIDLVFTDGKLEVVLLDLQGKKKASYDIKVAGVEEIKVPGLGSIAKLNLQGNVTQNVAVYYDFVGEKLILVGRIGWRPWEGFHLSGEYARLEKPK